MMGSFYILFLPDPKEIVRNVVLANDPLDASFPLNFPTDDSEKTLRDVIFG
jgi:hypothetical protein